MSDNTILSKAKERWGELAADFVEGYGDGAFQHYRMRGFPHYVLTAEEKLAEFQSLCDYGPAKIEDGVVLQTMHALGMCWSFFPHSWEVRSNDMLTPMEIFEDDVHFRRAIDKRIKLGSNFTEAGLRKTLKTVTGAQGVSNFRPSAAWAIWDRYCPQGGTVFDPSMGWGGRLAGAVACPKVRRYVGCDPATKTFAGLCAMADEIRQYIKRPFQAVLNRVGSEVYKPEPDSISVAFTSPPYFDTEQYSDEPTQSWVKYRTLDRWLNGFMHDTLSNCMRGLKSGGVMALNVNDDLAGPVNDLAIKIGFEPLETLRYALSNMVGAKHLGDNSEPILIWKKR